MKIKSNCLTKQGGIDRFESYKGPQVETPSTNTGGGFIFSYNRHLKGILIFEVVLGSWFSMLIFPKFWARAYIRQDLVKYQ